MIKMRLVAALIVLLALNLVDARLSGEATEQDQEERRLPKGGRFGQAKKASASQSQQGKRDGGSGSGSPSPSDKGGRPGRPDKGGRPGRPDKGGRPGRPDKGGRPGRPDKGGRPGRPDKGGPPKRPFSKPVPPLDIKPVEWKEAQEVVDDPDFMNLRKVQKAYVRVLNQEIEVEKEESDASLEEMKAENEATEAAKSDLHEKMVEAKMKAQAAKERADRARTKGRTLEATNEIAIKELLKAQEAYRAKLQTRTLKAATDVQEQVKKDKEQNKDKDRIVWRGMKEDAYVKTKKARDEAKKVMLMYPDACSAIGQGVRTIATSRVIELRRQEERLAKLPQRKEIPDDARYAAIKETKALVEEESDLAEAAEELAMQMMEDCKNLADDQEFLEARVLKIIENMQKRELAAIDADEALEKYAKSLEEKMEADKEANAAGKEEAEALSDKEREAALRRLEAAREKVREMEALRKKAAQGLIEADNENIRVLKSMVEEAQAAKEDGRHQRKLSPEQKQSMMILAELQLDQSRGQLAKYPDTTKDVSEKQEALLAALHERFEQEKAVLRRSEEEEAIAIKLVEQLEATQKSAPPDAAHKEQKEAIMQQLEVRKAVREAAEIAEDEVAIQKVELTQEQAIWEQSRETILEAEKWYEQLLLFEEQQAQAATDDGDDDDDGDEEN